MAKTYNIQVTENELRNITHGLNELHNKVVESLASVTNQMENAGNLRNYYKEKRQEVFEQAKSYNELLTSQPIKTETQN